MKFIETLNASFINVDEISSIRHELDENLETYSSYVCLKNGEKYDFLEMPSHFKDKSNLQVKLEPEHVVILHEIALEIILTKDFRVITMRDLIGWIWDEFLESWRSRTIERMNLH